MDQVRKHAESIISLVEKIDQDGLDIPHRVIHFNENPYKLEIDRERQTFQDIIKENQRLKARLELLESGNDADVTRRIDDAVNNNHQIDQLSRQVDELKKREQKILCSFRKTSREFREVCYLLTGYRVDALKDRIYRLSNMYAESEEDKLLFEIDPDGSIQLLQNDYSERLSEYISTYLQQADSFPAFLSSITLDLFKSSTQSAPMSMCMSTTVQENPNYTSRLNR